jgi:hypothetical protein
LELNSSKFKHQTKHNQNEVLDQSMMSGTFRGRNSTKHHGKCFKPNTCAYLSKIKDEQTSKARKASQETKI